MKNSYTWFWVFLGVISIIFHLWLVFSGLVPSLISRPIHMALAIPWIFLYTEKLNKPSYLNLTITIIGKKRESLKLTAYLNILLKFAKQKSIIKNNLVFEEATLKNNGFLY